jgi:hypothetical protein
MLPPYYAGSVAATFRAVFPDSILWIDPDSGTGIIMGRRAGQAPARLGSRLALPASHAWDWPGFDREGPEPRLKSPEQIKAQVALDSAGLETYAELGDVITDDNQLLSYGDVRRRMFRVGRRATQINLALVQRAAEVARSRHADGNRAPAEP